MSTTTDEATFDIERAELAYRMRTDEARARADSRLRDLRRRAAAGEHLDYREQHLLLQLEGTR